MRRKALSTLLPACALALSLATLASSAAQDGQMRKSLYERLGGYNAVAAVVDDFVGRLVADRQFERFFVGHSTDSKRRIRQHIVDQLCAAAGGPCVYTGRTMKDSHQGLGISEAEWDAAARHLVASLDKFKVPEQEKKDLLAFVASVRPDIVEKKQ
ncbi:MAG TPA: group 1 truncated hemoglobin [Pyrinomonadaceae bacterium]